jgi:UDPglucose 6-dehydrogenase
MKIVVVGTGYVGLVTGTCFAETGLYVTCVDIDKGKIKKLNNGEIPIYEPGLNSMVERNILKKRLFFSTNLEECLEGSEAVFIAVGTPADEDGSADLKYVLDVARNIGKCMKSYMVIITKSTVPIGTAYKVKAVIQNELDKRGSGLTFDVASNPEFLKEGNAVEDFLKPDRIVLGIDSEEAEKIMRKLYKPFLLNGHPLLFMDIPSAELTKYAANAMLATKISFMNEIANLCDVLGADVNMVRNGIGSDPRIGNKFIYAGIGYGGSCFPKDVKALINTADTNKYSLKILKAVEDVNLHQKEILLKKIISHFKGNIKDKTFGVWGLSFKPQTDDIRNAPSMEIIERLIEAGSKIKAYDPVAMEASKILLGNKIEFCKEPYDVLVNADALILVTEWSEFRLPNFSLIERLMKSKVIFDGRNIYEPSEMLEMGFTYYSIGRKTILSK